MVLHGGLNAKDLESLNGSQLAVGNFNHKQTLQRQTDDQSRLDKQEDLRSLRSEYDYGAKKKFVDVIGNVKKKPISGLDGLQDHPGAKNMDSASIRSGRSGRFSTLSTLNRRRAEAGEEPVSIKEAAEEDEDGGKTIFDENGNPIHLNRQQLALLDTLLNLQTRASLTEQQQELLKSINIEDLQNMDAEQIN
jgi:hypothetical protein